MIWSTLHRNMQQPKGGARNNEPRSNTRNLQNVPTEFTEKVPDGLMPIPNMRDYLLPEPGCTWVSRDFSAQEIRILAHFERGRVEAKAEQVEGIERATFETVPRKLDAVLYDAFRDDPRMDPHEMVRQLIGGDITRKQVKGIAFGILYGMGASGLATTLGVTVDRANKLLRDYKRAVPGAELVQNWTRTNGRITTAGGRKYVAERDEHGRDRSYKLTNYLIQGSAADQTKECMIHYFENAPAGSTFLCTVHDEINISLPDGVEDTLKEAMEHGADNLLSVPMVTTLSTGPTWGGVTDEANDGEVDTGQSANGQGEPGADRERNARA